MNIDHIAIWTIDLEKEKEFFIKYFGCKAGEKYLNSEKQFASYFITFPGGARIELMHRPGIHDGRYEGTAGLTHIAVNVGRREIVDQLTGKLENDGYIVAGRPRITGDGYYESVILDPEGNRIEILSL